MGRRTTLTILGKNVEVPLAAPRPSTHTRPARRTRAEFELSGPELDRFNELHPRGFGGRFGRKLAELAGVGRNDQNTHLKLPEDPDTEITREFDWEEPDYDRPNSAFTYFTITGPGEVTDDQTGETDTGEVAVNLHMAPSDYEEIGRVMSSAIMREKLKDRPLTDDDPLSLYLHAMLDLQDSSAVKFSAADNPWHDSQTLEFSALHDGSWNVLAEDEWTNQVDMNLTAEEFAALHAQLMRRVGTGPQPSGAKPVTKASPPSTR